MPGSPERARRGPFAGDFPFLRGQRPGRKSGTAVKMRCGISGNVIGKPTQLNDGVLRNALLKFDANTAIGSPRHPSKDVEGTALQHKFCVSVSTSPTCTIAPWHDRLRMKPEVRP